MVEGRPNNKKAKLNWSKIRKVVFGAEVSGSPSRLKHLVTESCVEEHDNPRTKLTKTFTHGIRLLNKVS